MHYSVIDAYYKFGDKTKLMTLIDANRDKLHDQIEEARNYMKWRKGN